MSTNHATVATHSHSLPSFNQAFSNRSLNNIPTANTLPPIQSRIPSDSYRVHSPGSTPRSRPSSHERSESKPSTRKRTHENITSSSRDEPDDEQRASPHLTQIKQEQDHDMLEPSSPPPPPPPSSDKQSDHRITTDSTDSPHSPSTVASPLKKRRVTISGAPHLNTNIRPPPVDQTNSTPISPAVVGFTVNRDNPAAVGQLRSAISVKQKQQALIEQRRGSLAGGPAPATPLNSNHPPPSSSEERISVPTAKTSGPPRSSRRSPNMATTARRVPPSAPPTGTTRPPSPCPALVPAQPQLHPSEQQQRQQQHPLMPAPTQTLPPPPISFARRRAGLLGAAGKRKPADILISPREAQSFDQFQPSIQSAPPIPHAAQGAFQSGRLAMALPRLPPVMSASDNVRRVASNVPPTPTRLSLLRPPATATATAAATTTVTTPMISVSGRSPPGTNVPIASTLVPPTPASLHHPGYSGDKSAFLAPFEIFYDALNDSKQLKIWLSEQLQRSNALEQSLSQQQDKFNDIIESTVEKRVSGMRAEMLGLRRRIEDLEDALRNATSDHRRHSIDMTGSSGGPLPKGKQPLRNGTNLGPSESYTFPPPLPQQQHEHSRHRPDPTRRIPSPSWAQERDIRGNPLHPPPPPPPLSHSGDNNSDRHASSPTPYDSPRRLASISATRLDPPRSRDGGSELSLHHPRPGVVGLPSPPQAYRDHPSDRNLPPIKDSHGRPAPAAAAAAAARNERERERERDSQQRPPLTRQHSHTDGNGGSPNAPPPPTPTSASSHSGAQQSSRRSGSRRNSVAMSPPDGHGGESS